MQFELRSAFSNVGRKAGAALVASLAGLLLATGCGKSEREPIEAVSAGAGGASGAGGSAGKASVQGGNAGFGHAGGSDGGSPSAGAGGGGAPGGAATAGQPGSAGTGGGGAGGSGAGNAGAGNGTNGGSAGGGSGGEADGRAGEAGSETSDAGAGGRPDVPDHDDLIVRSNAMAEYDGSTVYATFDHNIDENSRSEPRSAVVDHEAFELVWEQAFWRNTFGAYVVLFVDLDGDGRCTPGVDPAWSAFANNSGGRGQPEVVDFRPDVATAITCEEFDTWFGEEFDP